MSTSRTRVAVWGVGMTGAAVVQLVARNPELELVAGLGYNPAKKGRDSGSCPARRPWVCRSPWTPTS